MSKGEVVSLREFIELKINELEKRIEQQYITDVTAMEIAAKEVERRYGGIDDDLIELCKRVTIIETAHSSKSAVLSEQRTTVYVIVAIIAAVMGIIIKLL